MALSEIEYKRYEKIVGNYVESKRPPLHLRKELDFGFRIENQSIEIFEIRPAWREPGVFIELAVAKTTFVKRTRTWKLYWQRKDLNWHRYDPDAEHTSIEEVLAVIDADEYGCFYG
ncbi:MAG: DUF3024 domain-containing protein [Gammaproteobacteria bacterium]|nr:MAG: DUF3024 domain-containing protein [Gammaproteobacteria bacterium]